MNSLQNIPIPAFTASKEWGNQWNVGTNQNVVVYFDDSGRLRLDKEKKFTLHTVLSAEASDLEELSPGRGVPLSVAAAYTVSLRTRNDKGVRSRLVLHEFDEAGNRVARLNLVNGERSVYVPRIPTGRLVLSLRLVGEGGAAIEAIEFNPITESSYTSPGLHAVVRMNPAPKTKKKSGGDGLAWLMPIRRALYDGVPLSVLANRREAKGVADVLVELGHFLEAKEVARQFDLYRDLSTSALRRMFWHGRRTGYLQHAVECMDEVVLRSRSRSDSQVAERLRGEYEFHRDPWALMPELETSNLYDSDGPILHMVGKALPEQQTGYTVRTKYTVEALQDAGVTSVIAVQAGGNHEEGLEARLEHNIGGIRTVLMAGPAKKDVNRDEWLEPNVKGLYELVEEIRPSIIHAHSDFTNGALATHVGEATSVPVVYESRGFWEETWISRIGNAQGWENIELILKMYGAPDLYELRRQSERRVRERADRVVTLAQTMKDFILEESCDGVIPPEYIYLASNAVDPKDFPVGSGKPQLRRDLGIGDDEVVVGYISSIVEYEGIETLLEGYRLLKAQQSGARLLIVGDGPYLNRLKQHAERGGLTDTIFTGRVPHEHILDYYHSIDIFVVPRRNTRVTELVTPLKPFEAFSTGRPVVVSDVAALAEIAADSRGAASVFRADDAEDLALKLDELVTDPELRNALGNKGAEWVRQERSWSSNVPTYRSMYTELAK
ncbi:glycosyltransferase [Nesterenkonia haasae]|uniref:glycosyltransferase n=1 Tax=Nesterenkonia haasae TaxID=2587813 RepID=UPI001390E740|nr:glycosyltransferase [Nesterenkonia haasae]NDK33187.1 glycosyltransferase [Nesterenkonia haasae]